MVLFIDGLDEFKGRPTELVNDILVWANCNLSDLKICVASREWNDFLIRFKAYPRIRIQECTQHDIERYVKDQLRAMSDFSISVDQHELDSLAMTIVGKAEGVFIWVRVVLAAIEQGVLNGDGFRDLRRKVDTFPVELNDLYQHLFDSIPGSDRQAAFTVLSFSMIWMRPAQTLLQYKFLNDLSEDPDFAIKLSMQPLSKQALEINLTRASRLINGLCKGFLEIRSVERKRYEGEEAVMFMHSTVKEFLSQEHIVKIMESRLKGIDVIDQTCQSFLALTKSIDSDDFYYTPTEYKWDEDNKHTIVDSLNPLFELLALHPEWTILKKKYVPYSKRRLLELLDNIEHVVTARLEKRLESDYMILFLGTIRPSQGHRPKGLELEASFSQLTSVLAAYHLLVEYFDMDGGCDLRTLPTDSAHTRRILNAAFCTLTHRPNHPRALSMLKLFFKAGISPNVELKSRVIPQGCDRFNLLGYILLCLICRGLVASQGSEYRLIELFLRYGATEEFHLKLGPCYEEIGSDRLVVQVKCMGSKRAFYSYSFENFCVDYRIDIVRYARQKEGLLTLRDLLAHWFPHDFHHLYALLDKKSSIFPASDGIVESGSTRSVEMLDIFPEDKRVHFGEHGGMGRWKQCLSHSENCFTNFEARLGHSHR
ncbi:hypothetical protein F4779DRAFT_298994 [Xylariaceae sp. FL0662B]|nr:hypothetical protein F4779DRAFT_298994 [Xylariaceae sp. FL0662B]